MSKLTHISEKKPPKNLEEIRSEVFVENDSILHTSGITHPDAFSSLGIDNSLQIKNWIKNMKIEIMKIERDEDAVDDNRMIFDVSGIDAALANALRRILLSEIPVIAIDEVTFLQNNGVLHDEILAHRIGLIPIRISPQILVEDVNEENKEYNLHRDYEQDSHSQRRHNQLDDPTNTLIFKLHVTCTDRPELFNNPNIHRQDDWTKPKYVESTVYSGDIEWVPQVGQIERLQELGYPIPSVDEDEEETKGEDTKMKDTTTENAPKSSKWWLKMSEAISMVHKNIILTKLRPGQTIECWMKAKRGIGKDHAKWSPVGTASYRLLPEIILNNELLTVSDALYLKNICPMNVFDIEDISKSRKVSSTNKHGLKVSRPRDCSMCRECINKPEMKDKIQLRRKRDHFIFSIESIGQYRVQDLFVEAIRVLHNKCVKLLEGVEKMEVRETSMGEWNEDDADMEQID